MAELVSILEAMNEKEYADKKFAAAMQGVDLDKETGRQPKQPKQTQQKKASTFEDIQARVFSGGMAQDANDIMALQGRYGAQKGFQMGKDMGYGRFHDSDENAPKSPLG
jgi:hypothetical protein